MNSRLRQDADTIIQQAIHAVLPDEAVRRALEGRAFPGRVLLVAAGKAAWQMAHAAVNCLGDQLTAGVVVTKYDHVKGELPRCTCYEAGHPVPDQNSFRATQAALDLVAGTKPEDTVLFLLSGGGSALFEKPLIPGEELQDITGQLLACGADIVEMNTVAQAPVGGQGRAALPRPAPRPRVYAVGAVGHPGGPAGHDRLGARLPRLQHLRRRAGGGGEIWPQAQRSCHGLSPSGDPQAA